MTQEEFKELSQRFYKASQLQSGIYNCQEKLNELDNAGPHTYDGLYSLLRGMIPSDCVDDFVEDLKVRFREVLQKQIKIYEQKFEEL